MTFSNGPTKKMLIVTLDPKMGQELEQLATTTGHSKGFYVHEALSEYLVPVPIIC